jgi:hypothetical protein
MRCRVALILAVSIALGIAGTAWAFPPSNPYQPDAANIQSMIDRTGDFSGNAQASTETHSNIPGGLKVNVTWSTGTSGLFGGTANESFTRIVLTHQYSQDGVTMLRGDLSPFDGVDWIVTSDTAFAIKPYTQVGTTFTFGEGTEADAGCGVGTICVPGGNVPTHVKIDWNMVNNFAGGTIPLGPGTGTRQDIFEHGFQIFGPSLAQDSGLTASSMFTITSAAVPEPASIVLAFLGGIGLIGLAGRKLRK